jgi:hypothetical protein
MYGTCDSILTSEARVQFLVSKAFHGSELIGIASDTEDNWQFLVSSVEASSVNDCQLNVRSFASFTSLDGNNPNTSRIGEITVLGSIRPCNYNFFFRYTGTIDFFYADGAVRCSAIDQGTAHCVGFIDTNILIGFADTLDGQYPKTARVQGDGVAEVVWEFRGRQLLMPILIRQ